MMIKLFKECDNGVTKVFAPCQLFFFSLSFSFSNKLIFLWFSLGVSDGPPYGLQEANSHLSMLVPALDQVPDVFVWDAKYLKTTEQDNLVYSTSSHIRGKTEEWWNAFCDLNCIPE